jgi:hypothetical protein
MRYDPDVSTNRSLRIGCFHKTYKRNIHVCQYTYVLFQTHSSLDLVLGHATLVTGCWFFCTHIRLKLWHRWEFNNLFTFHSLLIPWRQKPKAHHRTHEGPPAVPILSQVNPLNASPPPPLPAYHLKVHSDPALSSTPRSYKWSFSPRLSSPLPCVPHAPPTPFSLIWSA